MAPCFTQVEARVAKMALVGPLSSNTQRCDLLPTCSLCSFQPSHTASPPLHWPSSLPQTTAWLIPSPLLSLLGNHLLSGVSSDYSISYGNLSSYLSFPIRTLVQRPEAEILLVLFMNAFLVPRRPVWCVVLSTFFPYKINYHFFLYKSLWCILIILIRLSIFLTF